jgi:hypothetical protein
LSGSKRRRNHGSGWGKIAQGLARSLKDSIDWFTVRQSPSRQVRGKLHFAPVMPSPGLLAGSL